jgi:hypothetical protein
VRTDTYAKEDGKWRRLVLNKTYRAIRNKMKNGDKAGAVYQAERWLNKDPNSVSANYQLFYAMDRTNTWRRKMRKRRQAIIRRLMAINPNDSDSLFMSATHQSSIGVAKAFVGKMDEKDCRRGGAVFNVANKYSSHKKRWAFLQGQPNLPIIAVYKVYTLGALKKYDEAKALLAENDAAMAEYMKTESSSFAAEWSANIGEVYRRMKNTEKATEWMTRAITFDPNSSDAKRLARRLR